MLVFSMTASVDGFVADRDGDIGFFTPSDELHAFHLELVREHAGYLLGRRLYELMSVWETDPAMRERPFADVWAALPKVVFSRTLTDVPGNARLATGTLADEVAAFGDVELSVGGVDLAGQALTAGLVDELRVFRAPVLLGGGTPMFPLGLDPLALELVETRTFPDRVVFERYRR